MEFKESAAAFLINQYNQMEENQESKFVCKLCNKKYPCGKSLGGHMRSHVMAANSAESEGKVEPTMKKVSSLLDGGAKFSKKESSPPKYIEELGGGGGGQNGQSYGLRENPKKTWRAADQNLPLPQEKVCKQCGKVFQSLKALCGHMACHSEKDRGGGGGGTKDDHSWTSENQKLVMDSHSDTEAEERKLRSKTRSSKRFKRIIIKTSSYSLANNTNNATASSSVSEIDEQEQEEVAICLMMLSRDSGCKVGVNSVVESSDNNSVVLETKSSSIEMRIGKTEGLNCVYNRDETLNVEKVGYGKLNYSSLDAEMVQQENSDSGYFLSEATKGESDVSVDGIRRNAAYWECTKSKPYGDAKYEEGLKIKGYKTVFRKENGVDNGGSKKRSKDVFDDDELVAESYKRIKYGSADAEVSNSPHKRSKYECLNCKKSFKSYQALGGHRPCHKRSNAWLQSKYETGENSSDADDNVADHRPSVKLGQSLGSKKAVAKEVSKKAEKKVKSKKHKGHVCPFCHRVFKSGQALGGHKRSHFLGGNEETSTQSAEIKPEVHDLFDLNLPAPADDEEDGNVQFSSW